MKKFYGITLCLALLSGCAGQAVQQEEANNKILRENEKRLHSLENSITALNTQVAQLNNRVYEVRNKNGQRTAMTVVPIVGGAQAQVAQPVAKPVAPVSKPVAPVARQEPKKIDPKAKPTPLPAAAKPASPAPVAQTTPPPAPEQLPQAGSSGQLSGSSDLALPPDEIPVPQNNTDMGNTMTAHASSVTIAPPQGNVAESAVPVPLMPASDLSLPPEHPELPPMGEAAPAQAPQPVPQAQPVAAQQAPRASAKGEEAAYNNALKAARAGRTQEGIKLFREFLQKYPNGKYAANADFWIGECLYSQGKYQDALNQFQVVNNTFPSHHKNADALLKAGMTMQKMGNQAGAQEKYRQLIASFPNSDAARRARAMGAK